MTETICIYKVISSAKSALGRFNLPALPQDSLPKVVITGISLCYGIVDEDALLHLGMSKSEYVKAVHTFRKANVAVVCSRADSLQQQIAEAARQVDMEIRRHYVKKQLVEL